MVKHDILTAFAASSPFTSYPKGTMSKSGVKLSKLLYPLFVMAMLVVSSLACAPQNEGSSPNSTNNNSVVPSNTVGRASSTPSAAIILDVTEVLGLGVTEVENKLGTASNVLPFAAGEIGPFGGAGTTRDYHVGKYLFTGYYDTSDILQEIQVMDGLSEEEYSLDDWSTLLARFGLPKTTPADSTFPAALRWDNLHGYWVWLVASSSTGEPVWTIQVWLVDRAEARIGTRSPSVPVPNGATVNDAANLRKGPGTDYPVVGAASAGEIVQVVARDQGDDWYQLDSGAWIAGFLIDNAPSNLPVGQNIQ